MKTKDYCVFIVATVVAVISALYWSKVATACIIIFMLLFLLHADMFDNDDET